MVSQEQSTQTDRSVSLPRRLFALKLQGGLKFISSLLLPLALGVFTIVITFDQQKAAKQQRDEDRYASKLQREQDKTLNDERYKNELLNTYIKDMAKLLDKKHGSLTFDQVTATVARAKTLNTFRELDPHRSIRIIRFLYEAGQLNYLQNYSSLDLSTAEFRDIDFRELAINKKKLGNLSLIGMFLSNATFIDIEIDSINFAKTQFDNVNFSSSRLSKVNFSSAKFYNASFLFSQHEYIDFSSSELDTMNFSFSRLENNISFAFAKVNNTDFSNTQLVDVRFSKAELDNINFSPTSFLRVQVENSLLFNCRFLSSTFIESWFSLTRFDNVNLKLVTLKKVQFSKASFFNADLSSARLEDTQFNSTIFKLANFASAVLAQVQFVSTELHKVSFSSAEFQNSVFSISILDSANFNDAKILGTRFENTTAIAADFTYANLSNSKFINSNVKHAIFTGADLTNVDFHGANLHKADFTNTNISDNQLHSALSIQDAILPNGTRSQDKNLINNGQADCNIRLVDSWKLERGDVTIEMSEKNNTNCQFTLKSLATEAIMLQRVNLSEKWDSSSWPYSKAILSARMSMGVSIQLKGINTYDVVSGRQTLSSTEENIILFLRHGMQELEVFVEFSTLANQTTKNPWCDDIKLYIIYGTDSESSQVIPNIPSNAQWQENAITVAGGNGYGNGMNQLSGPRGLYVDDDQIVYVVDQSNHRIMEWKSGATSGKVVAGGNGQGNGAHQLDRPYDVIVEKESDSLIISSWGNNRIIRWPRRNVTSGETIISNISCGGLIMDENGSLYVADWLKHEVKRYRLGDTKGTVVAGGNGQGNHLNQLYNPWYVFVDQDHSVYVSDRSNNRVMKWEEGAKQGVVVAGGQGQGNSLTQLHSPLGVVIDQVGTVYVADRGNYRIMRWPKGATQGSVIAGGDGQGAQSNQLNDPWGLSFDRYGNLYVVDYRNDRVQRFAIKSNN